VREEKREWTDVKMDVPQGSILGLLLYAICVNNLPESVEQCQVKQYADDTAICFNLQTVSVVSSLASMDGGKGLVN